MLGDLDQPPQRGDLPGEQAVSGAEVVEGVGLGVLEDGGDLVEGEAEFAVEEDLLEPGEVGVAVEAVAGRAVVAGGEQAEGVVVVQGAHRDPREAGGLSDRVAHRSAFRPALCGRPGGAAVVVPHVGQGFRVGPDAG